MKIIKIANANEVFEDARKRALQYREIAKAKGLEVSDHKLKEESMSIFKEEAISKASSFISAAQIYSDGLTQGLKDIIESLNSGDIDGAKHMVNEMTYSTEILENGTDEARQFMEDVVLKIQNNR